MAVTGPGTFETHEAADFAESIGSTRSLGSVQAALATATASARPTLREGAEALVAAEMVAGIEGRPSPFLPSTLVAWLAEDPPAPDPGLLELARRATSSVFADDSELCELGFRDAGAPWADSVNELRGRLGS